MKIKKVLKGVTKAVVKNQITHEDYKDVMTNNEPIEHEVTSIRSFNHQLYTHKNEKGLFNILSR